MRTYYPISNIWNGKETLILEEFESICDNCEGKGGFRFPEPNGCSSEHYDYIEVCKICGGTGKIDWITKLRKYNESEYHHPRNQIRGSTSG